MGNQTAEEETDLKKLDTNKEKKLKQNKKKWTNKLNRIKGIYSY